VKDEENNRWIILFIIVAVLSLIFVSALTFVLHKVWKLPGHRPGLPGRAISFYIVPLDPANNKAGFAGHLPANG
jgi:hypothetical protein